MKLAHVLGIAGVATVAAVGLVAQNADALAHARVSTVGWTAANLFADNGAADNARGRLDKPDLTITVELNAGTVGATARLLTAGGSLVGNCTVTDPAPPNGTRTDKICNTLVNGAFLDLTVD